MNNSAYRYYLLFSAILFGFLITVQFKANLSSAGIVTIQQIVDMDEEYKNLKKEKDNLHQSISDLIIKLEDYKIGIEETGSIYSSMRYELDKVKQCSGLMRTEGPGIIIVLNDSTYKVGEEDNPQWFLIHDIDILEVINELRAFGAEEISINDERVMPNTYIRCGGPIVFINGIRHATPFVIKAIGDPKTLEASVLAPGSYVDLLEYNGISVKVQKVENLVIDEYNGRLKLNYQKVIEGGE